MKVGIFYFSTNDKDWQDKSPVSTPGDPFPVGWVRVEVVDAANLVEALDKAKPREGEAVMNTHRLRQP